MMNAFLSELFSLQGRVALCTGGASGIGSRMGLALARAGADVVLVDRDPAGLIEAAGSIAEAHAGGSATLTANLLDRDGLQDLVSRAGEFFGAPDILVNAAGVNLREPAEEISWDSWDQTLDINLAVPFFLARLCVPDMKARGRGKIINIASLQSFRAFPNSMQYGASKGGVAQLTRAMAEAWSRDGITANAIAPGFFPTGLTKSVFDNPEIASHNARMTAIGRNGELADLDGATIFLASAASSYITGQVLPVDGGYSAK
jgi:NAD(P)-dependent dehydrogenase (short-subunit alcohol dehydrogenase family)